MKLFAAAMALPLTLLAACGSAGEVATSAASSTTSTAVVTTTPPSSTTSTLAASTAGSEISRSTALAVQKCLEAWNGERQKLIADGPSAPVERKAGWTDALTATCKQAKTELEIDSLGAPKGNTPLNVLALILADIMAKAADGQIRCTFAALDKKPCLVGQDILDLSSSGLPEPFRGSGLINRPAITDIPGLRIRS